MPHFLRNPHLTWLFRVAEPEIFKSFSEVMPQTRIACRVSASRLDACPCLNRRNAPSPSYHTAYRWLSSAQIPWNVLQKTRVTAKPVSQAPLDIPAVCEMTRNDAAVARFSFKGGHRAEGSPRISTKSPPPILAPKSTSLTTVNFAPFACSTPTLGQHTQKPAQCSSDPISQP